MLSICDFEIYFHKSVSTVGHKINAIKIIINCYHKGKKHEY